MNAMNVRFIHGVADTVGRGMWASCTLSGTGCIVGIPYCSTNVIEIHGDDDTFVHFGCTADTSNEKWYGGPLSLDGTTVIGIPFMTDTVLAIDTLTRSLVNIKTGTAHMQQAWHGGCNTAANIVYASPCNASSILCIDCSTLEVSRIGSLPDTPSKYRGALTGSNSFVYFVPYEATQILELNPFRQSMRYLETNSQCKWLGSVLTPNGDMYFMPVDSRLLVVSVKDSDKVEETSSLEDVVLSLEQSRPQLMLACQLNFDSNPNTVVALPFASEQYTSPVTTTPQGDFGFPTFKVQSWISSCIGSDGSLFYCPQNETFAVVAEADSY